MLQTKKAEWFFEFGQELKQAGFRVFSSPGSNYGYFVKDNKIGYFEASDFGWNFSTVHKPCREYGTGFSIHRERPEATVKMAEDCLIVAPGWAHVGGGRRCSACGSITHRNNQVIKYKSWEDYISDPRNQWREYLEI